MIVFIYRFVVVIMYYCVFVYFVQSWLTVRYISCQPCCMWPTYQTGSPSPNSLPASDLSSRAPPSSHTSRYVFTLPPPPKKKVSLKNEDLEDIHLLIWLDNMIHILLKLMLRLQNYSAFKQINKQSYLVRKKKTLSSPFKILSIASNARVVVIIVPCGALSWRSIWLNHFGHFQTCLNDMTS